MSPRPSRFSSWLPRSRQATPVVLKPAPETVLDEFLMAEAALEAGLPPGVLNVVPAAARSAATWSVTRVWTRCRSPGRPRAAPSPRRAALLRPVTLELGGKSAAIILDDADLSASLESFFGATLLNNGQSAGWAPACWRPPAGRRRRRGRHGPGALADDRRPARAGHQDRPAGLRAAATPRRVLHCQGQGRGRSPDGWRLGARRTSTVAGSSSRPSSPTSTPGRRSRSRRSSGRCSP